MSSAPKSAPKPALDRPQPKTEPTVEELQEMYDGDDFVLGIDEAGRGPVLGPMVYGCAFCRLRDWDRVKALGVADSKKMTEANRDKVAAKIRASEFCEFITVSLHARDISAWMQQRGGDTTLNTVSHDCAIYLIDSVLQATGGPCSMADTDQKVAWRHHPTLIAQNAGRLAAEGFSEWKAPPGRGRLRAVFVDTVGTSSSYQLFLKKFFPFLHVRVESKADDTYAIVGAASIMAKTRRDAAITQWRFEEPGLQAALGTAWGTGYPSEADTQKWLARSVDRVFGYPSVVRFSWSTARNVLETRAARVTFDDLKAEAQQQPTLAQAIKRRRCQYFEEVRLLPVDQF